MVKQRQKQLMKQKQKPEAKSNITSSNLIDSPNSRTQLDDLYGEDSWVIVKKQRVTILIPPLPQAATKPSTIPSPRSSQPATSWAHSLEPEKITKQNIASSAKPKFVSTGFFDRSRVLNKRLRASNIERKIRRAGGLSQWLASLGLKQFVRLFRRKSVGKFQLVNLTMKKLKEMGADAVGPRRKLMHAIDCLCQPYCFEMVSF